LNSSALTFLRPLLSNSGQNGIQRRSIELTSHHSLPQLLQQHQAQLAVQHFLVDGHQPPEILGPHARRGRDRQPCSSDDVPCTLSILIGEPSELRRHVQSHDHACTHCLSMQADAISVMGLYRRAEGMTEIEDGTYAALSLICSHHPGLD